MFQTKAIEITQTHCYYLSILARNILILIHMKLVVFSSRGKLTSTKVPGAAKA